MRKLGLGALALLIVGVIYYFTSGSAQLTQEIKKQVNHELAIIQHEGFSVQNRETNEKNEHFVISFDDPQKIAKYLTQKGMQINANDAAFLKGLQFGVDIHYLPDTYSSVSLDMYPVALPEMMVTSMTGEEDKKVLAQIQKMLEKKTFLMHLSLNKLGTGFKGYAKDIDEVLHIDKDLKLTLKGMTFTGSIKHSAIHSLKQNLKEFALDIPDEMSMVVHGLKSDYVITGSSAYDYDTTYTIKNIQSQTNHAFNFSADNLQMHSRSSVKDGLVSGSITTLADQVVIQTGNERHLLHTVQFDMNASNLDVTAFEALQQINVYDEKAVNATLQKLISKGVQLEMPVLSVANIETKGKKLEGLQVTGKMNIDKSLDVSVLDVNPMLALAAVDASLHLTLSNDVFNIISQRPEAMMALMIFQPKNVNGKKVYSLELKDGRFTVNNMPLM